MIEALTWLASQLWGIAIGVVTSLIVFMILNIFSIQENARFKLTYLGRYLVKRIRNPLIDVRYRAKSRNLEEKNFIIGSLMQDLKRRMTQNGFTWKSEHGNTIKFEGAIGGSKFELALSPSYITEENGSDELAVDYLECEYYIIKCKYNDFTSNLLDLVQIFRKLENCLMEIIGNWTGESLECEVNRMYEFTGVLKELEMSSLHGTISKKYKIELFEKKLLAYGNVESEMASALKKIITFYL